MNKFCPKCGKTISRGVFCNECNPVVLEFKPVKVKLCPTNKFFFRGKWARFDDLNQVTQVAVEKTFKKDVEIIEGLEAYPDILAKTGIKKDFNILIGLDGEEYQIPVSVEVTTSPSFSKVGSTYFEGILQLRNADMTVKEFVKDVIDDSENIYVNKIIEKETYVDFYFVKKKLITRVAEKIVDKFGGFMDANAQLFTQDSLTSRDLFRLNVVVHIPPFKKDDVVEKGDDLFLITSVGKVTTCLDLKHGKNVSFKYAPHELREYKILEKQKTKIISTHPKYTALSNTSYELVELENPKGLIVEKDQNVSVVEYKGRSFLIK